MDGGTMSTVTIGVSSLDDVMRRTAAAFRGKPQGEHISFASVELLWKTLTPRRWALIRAMAGKGPMSMRAAGRLVGHDIKTIHGDVQALLAAGVLEKDEAGRIVFPYDAIHVDFMIEAA
jgi:predicted transcriptional regulator